MKATDLLINEKYRPIAKTVGDSWEESFEIRAMKNNDQDFLYYTGIEPTSEGEQHSFHHDRILGNESTCGDFFKPEDMIEYIDIGDFVEITDRNHCHTQYQTMFAKMGFRDHHSNVNDGINKGDIGKVFGCSYSESHHPQKIWVYGVEFPDGQQILINNNGVKKTKAPKATEDNMDFKKWASRWADENPTKLVNGTPAHAIHWDWNKNHYVCEGVMLIDILDMFRKEYKSRKEWQPVTIEYHIAEVEKAGYKVIINDDKALEKAFIDYFEFKGWTITPPPPKKWQVTAEFLATYTETIEADTEEEAVKLMKEKHENGDLENPMGSNDHEFVIKKIGEIK